MTMLEYIVLSMCGIFGFYSWPRTTSYSNAAQILLEGLHALEYRGYDSAGVAVSDTQGKSYICKSIGNVTNLQKKVMDGPNISDSEEVYVSGIAHTRWATHGPPSDTNSHPHVSCDDNTFQVVHNGIISNSKYLKTLLEDNDFDFYSQTDTEVIPKLFKFIMDNSQGLSFLDLCLKVTQQIDGKFAVLVTSNAFPNEYIAFCKGSPLIVGRGEDGCLLFSSDICSLAASKQVVVLSDMTIFHADHTNYSFYDFQGRILDKCVWSKNRISSKNVGKGDYETFLEKEIFEQPLTLSQTVEIHVYNNDSVKDRNSFVIPNNIISKIISATEILLIGCGTSYHSCQASRPILSELLNKSVYVEIAGELEQVGHKVSPNTIYVFVSQSGETSDTLEALRYVKSVSHESVCLALTNNTASSLARESTFTMDLNAGIEKSVASTKAYTSQLVTFIILCMHIQKHLDGEQDKDYEIKKELTKLPETVRNTLHASNNMFDIALVVQKYKSFLFIGRGSDYATANEAALKVKEIAYIHSEGILASELKHGPLAMIDDDVCLFVFLTQNQHYKKMVSVVEQLLARKAHVYVVCDEENMEITGIVEECRLIRVQKTHPIQQHIVNIIPMQLLAFYLAVLRGNHVDQPRNLAKSVTVSD